MDRSKDEELEQQQQPVESHLTNPILTPLITTTTSNILTASIDDDTSTESCDTFETWTLVNDKQTKKSNPKLEDSDSENRLEILKNSEPEDEDEQEDKIKDQQLLDSLNDVTNDDFSDGISIISESESVGRISPHPYLTDHLQDLSLKFSTTDNIDDGILKSLRQETPIILQREPIAEQQLRKRRRSSTPTTNESQQALQKASQTLTIAYEFPPLVKRGLQGIFYVAVGLAILALIGRIVNPTWQPLNNVVNPTSAELEQKVNDMELQNNLMRAEIDLLNKQVKYLNTLNDPQQQQQQKGKYKDYKDGKTFKAWSGNGDSLKPVDITKEDLKRPYKCPDGEYVEMANMCIEQRGPNEPNIVDQFSQVVEDLKQQSEVFKTFEQVAEELQGFQDNPFEQLEKVLGEGKPTPKAALPTPPQQTNEYIKNKPIYQAADQDLKQKLTYKEYQHPHKSEKYDDSSRPPKEYKKSFGKENNSEFKDQHKKSYEQKSSQEKFEKFDKFRDNIKERFEKFKVNAKQKYDKLLDNSKENLERFEKFKETAKVKYDKLLDDSMERIGKFKEHLKFGVNSKERNAKKPKDNERDGINDSKERNKRKIENDSEESKEYSSKERNGRKFENDSKEYSSKERYNRQKRNYQKDEVNDDNSGEWQDKYMKHRENQRKENEQKYQDNKNWYIKRGDSRENKRSGEKHTR